MVPTIDTVKALIYPPSDEETLLMFTPEDDISREIEEFIQNHPLAVEMRLKPEFSESRPHLKIPQSQRNHNLTGGTLLGPGRVVVPPFTWSEKGGKSIVAISYLGTDLCGHVGIVHGGFLATMLDEGLARCCFAALPNKIGMTANLNINYRSPTPAGTFVVLRAKTVKVEGRKAWVEGHIETLVDQNRRQLWRELTLSLNQQFSYAMIEPSKAYNKTFPTPPTPPKLELRTRLTKAHRNITWHASALSRQERNNLRNQRGFTIWFTGLSASGKSTLATALEQHLLHLGLAAYRLDGDNVRFGLNKDLGFSEADRNENIRRIAEVAKLFADSATIALTSFISPYRADRLIARNLHTAATQGGDDPIPFIEVFVDIPIEVAEQRDPKGLYKKARDGKIPNFTGISAPYEEPQNAEIHIRTDQSTVEECVVKIMEYLQSKDLLPEKAMS
ncbi:hypothetical protein B7494_g2681 [Chlorociboria aeruginascens]|nr:hypothetical protein B7494_g2681 [Chlorociboria aeruginascens]